MVGWCSGPVGAVFPDSMRETSASISWCSGNLRHLVFLLVAVWCFFALAWFSGVVDVVVDC